VAESRPFGIARRYLSYGCGISGNILPVPFIEAGLRMGAISARGRVGYFVAIADGRAELALFERLYINNGRRMVIQSDGPVHISGVGVDFGTRDRDRYWRFGCDFWKSQGGSTVPLPGVGWGLRF